jgi:hypothetical protein
MVVSSSSSVATSGPSTTPCTASPSPTGPARFPPAGIARTGREPNKSARTRPDPHRPANPRATTSMSAVMSAMDTVLWAVQVLLAVVFVVAG